MVLQEKNRKRGRNKISAKLRRKQKNVIDEQTSKLREKQRELRDASEKLKNVKAGKFADEKNEGGALSRFSKH